MYLIELECNGSIPHATCCEGYNLFDPSDSQSVNLVFSGGRGCFVNANPESAQRKFVKLCRNEDILCTCAYLQEFMSYFFRELRLFTYTTETVCQRNSTEPLNRISCKFVGQVDIGVGQWKFLFNFFLRKQNFVQNILFEQLEHVYIILLSEVFFLHGIVIRYMQYCQTV